MEADSSGTNTTTLPVLYIRVLNADTAEPKLPLADTNENDVIGTCHYIVPNDVLTEGTLREVVVRLTPLRNNDRQCRSCSGEIQLRLKRGKLNKSSTSASTAAARLNDSNHVNSITGPGDNSSEHFAGVLYIFSRDIQLEKPATNFNIQAMLETPTTKHQCKTRAMTTTAATTATTHNWSSRSDDPHQDQTHYDHHYRSDVFDLRNDCALALAMPVQFESMKHHVPHPDTYLSMTMPESGGKLRIEAAVVRAIVAAPDHEFRNEYENKTRTHDVRQKTPSR
jgi:hypothetical protein